MLDLQHKPSYLPRGSWACTRAAQLRSRFQGDACWPGDAAWKAAMTATAVTSFMSCGRAILFSFRRIQRERCSTTATQDDRGQSHVIWPHVEGDTAQPGAPRR